ncbi:MAG TPA: IS256 family transposase [candidate division WOR-3 bacterium]|uniref:Mutator family transposase n=1 Tax=candidate division WOR-3 bacterium TaxID=2052148 RepID=A0A7V0T4V2_UNCW3|nr:IS256 family transposase [candidate division WOR-3 bacterium]
MRSRRTYRKKVFGASPADRLAARRVLAALDGKSVYEMLQEGLHSVAMEIGRLVAIGLLDDEVTKLCGERYLHNGSRTMVRHGHRRGWAEVAGQKVPLGRPRVRHTDGSGEARLPVYGLLQQAGNFDEAVLRRVVHGVSTRSYEQVIEDAREGFGVKRASVSRRFVRVTGEQIRRFCERRWDGVPFVAIIIDGKSFAGEMMVTALGITASGEKHILGLRQGASENAQVCKELLESLRERGVATGVPTLFVLDGAKALHAAVRSVWGDCAIIQRCQVHKKRNVRSHLDKKYWAELDRRLAEAWGERDYERALELMKQTAAWLARINPDAAASLREGMAETLTVVRLGVAPALRKTLSNTNVIESAFSVTEQVTKRVKHWRAGNMRWRWCLAGLLHAEQHFHRVAGYRRIAALVKVLDALSPKVDSTEKVA